ncbi:MAG: TetR/AcrR family transcriptional regulator [Mariniphaga sp.]|nr:TetR/AcrR family transcriptional regulator [Mariniphaga sp.]MDD4424696.1 TetR/AcrR family transcriptional regulator [Mariniphaga sp.]
MEIQDRIVENATKQFLQFGIRNVTMDGIATELGISKRTVYENYKDKTELVRQCMEYMFRQHEMKTREVIATSKNVIVVITVFMRVGMQAMNAINPVFFQDMKKFYPAIWKIYHQRNLAQSFQMIEKLLKQGIQEKLFREDINLKIISKLFYEQNNMIMDENIFPRNEFNLPEIFQNLTINFLRGISTNRGIKIIDELMKE